MKRRKFLAVILIISMFFTNIGVETFATSFSNILKVKKDDDVKIELQQRYYKEYRRESSLYLLNDENNEVDNDNVGVDTNSVGAKLSEPTPVGGKLSEPNVGADTDKNISIATKSHIKNVNHSTESNIENLNESDISDEDDDETQSDTRDSNVAEPENDPVEDGNTTSEDVETTINKSSEVETNLDNVGTPTDEPDSENNTDSDDIEATPSEPDSVATNSDIDETSNDKTTEADINITSNDNLASTSITNEVAEASISDILLNDILDIPTTLPTPSTADDETFDASRVYWYIAVTGTIYTLYFSNTSAASYGAAANGQFNSAITGMDSQGWNTYKSLIRNVIISNNITPPGDSMAYWFQGLTNVTSITGLNRIDTSNVTDFERTFQNCSSLTSLDLSSFNTSNATNMKYMFGGCSSLTSLNISSFDTSNVTTMENMFYNCSSLTNINLSSFNTSHVTSMDSMFSGASSLNSISLSNFNTSNVDSMHSTFDNCTNLTILDLSNFDTHNVSAMSNMFNNCTNLTTIYASSKFVITNVVIPNLTDMFTNCTSLAGDSGTTFTSAGVTNATYAHLDGGSSNPGYFSNPPLRWYLTTTTNANDTLHIASGSNTAYDSATNKGTFTTFNTSTSQGWNSFKSNITKVVIDNNLKPVKNNMMHWFNGLSIVTEFTNLNNINTSTVTNMEALFSNCLQLTNLDLSSFDTSNVTNMNDMFADTTHLNNINLSSFDTRNVTSMKNMFYDCRDINILNLSTFDTSNVTDMRWMFYNCSNLSTIYASTKFITTAVTQSSSMFSACTNLLQGENGTIWSNSNPADKTYARLDGGTANPGYFSNPPLYWYLTTATNTNDTLHISSVSNASYDSATNKGTFTNFTTSTSQPWNTFKSNITNIIIDNTIKPRKNDMSYWFTNITNLTSITNINNIDTSDTTNMQYAFASCSNLTSVNINSFNTSNVTSVTNMFSNCNNLSTITLPTSFGQNATDFSNLFKNCNNLQTINLNNINTSHATTFEHMFDCCSSLTSIDVSGFSTNNVTNMSYMFASCSNLTNIDASNFNTRYTNNTSYMFSNCSQIQTISLGALDYTDFENLDYMFANCSNLTTINVSVDIQVFVLAAGYGVPSASSTNMFLNCNNLVGGAGYPYNPNHIDGEFAKVDHGGIYPGYFTYNGTTPIDYSAWSYTLPANWKANLPIPATDITEIIFTDATTFPTTTDEFILTSVAAGTITVTPINHFGYVDGTTVIFHKKAGTQLVAPTDMSEYFANLPNLERITNINLLNTNNVTSTRELFNSNAKLQNIDLSALNLNNVLDTSNMFNGCATISSITLPTNFGELSTTMAYMFAGCNNLQTLNVNDIRTTNATNMTNMFAGCNRLTTLNLSNFNTNAVVNMSNMFENCSMLTSITFPANFGQNATYFSDMFSGCSAFTTLDLSRFSTNNATSMARMFKNMTNLQTLFIDSFDTNNVTDMTEMFMGLSNISSIFVNAAGTFVTTSVSAGNDTDMFANCSNQLKGSKGTTWLSTNPTDKTYAIIDNSPANPGYFSSSNIYIANLNANNGTFSDGTSSKSIYITLGDPTNTFEEPTRVGYTFNEWRVNGVAITPTWTYTTNRTETVIAHYATNSYTVHYDLNGGTGTFNDQPIYYDDTFSLHVGEPTLTGYTFAGWKLNDTVTYEAGKTGLINLTATNNDTITLTATYDPNEFNIIFNKNEPASPDTTATNEVLGNMTPQRIRTNETFTLNRNNYTLKGYTFIGWATSSYIPSEAELMRDNHSNLIINNQDDTRTYIRDTGDDITYYALWTRNEYRINILQNEANDRVLDPLIGSASILYDTTYNTTNLFDAVGAVRPGYIFTNKWIGTKISTPLDKKNYNANSSAYVNGNTLMRDDHDLTYYPLWLNEEHTVTLDLNGGTLPTGFNQNTFTAYIDEPYFTKGIDGEPKNSDGSLVSPVASDSELSIFDYWSEDAAGTNRIDEWTKYTDPTITTIYANYKTRETFTISFNANGGNGTMESVEILEGDNFDVPRATFTRSGYTTNSYEDQNGNRYDVGTTIRNVRTSLELKALWTRDNSGNDDGGNNDGNNGGNNSGNNGGSTGGNGSGTGGGSYRSENNSIPILSNTMNVTIGATDYDFIKNENNVKIGVKIRKESAIGELLTTNDLYKSMWITIPDDLDHIRLTNGFYRLSEPLDDRYYALDKEGNIITGFVETVNQKYYELDTATGNIKETDSSSSAKYYFYDSNDEWRGILWMSPIEINGIEYTFDGQGHVIKEEVAVNTSLTLFDENINVTQGHFEYNPETNGWKFYLDGIDGNKIYALDGFYKINVGGKDNYFMFDENGNMKTGFVRYHGNTYYLQEYGVNRGAVYTGTITVKGIEYIFDEKGVLINAMDKKMSTPIVGRA